MKELIRFLKKARIGYLLFTSLIIVGLFYGISEIISQVFFTEASPQTMKWMYFSCGIIVSLTLMKSEW